MILNRAGRREIYAKIIKNKKIDLSRLKYVIDFDSTEKLLAQLPKSKINIILSNPLPKNVSDLDKAEVSYERNNLLKEIDWGVLRIITCRKEINEFVDYQSTFENYLLLSDYEQCEKVLEKIEKEICFSLWGMEKKLLVAELKNNTESNRSLFQTITKDNLSQDIRFRLYYTGIKYEVDITANSYNSIINFHLKKFKSHYSEELKNFVQFNLVPFSQVDAKSLSFILCRESSLSVIDSYLILKKSFAMLISLEKDSLIQSHIENRIAKLNAILIDKGKIKLKRNDVNTIQNNDAVNSTFNLAIKYIENNDLKSCLNFLAKQLATSPNNYNLYQLFVDVLIIEGRDVKTYLKEDTNLYKILNTIFSVSKKDSLYSESIEYLDKLTYIYDSQNFSLPLGLLWNSEKYLEIPDFLKGSIQILKSDSLIDSSSDVESMSEMPSYYDRNVILIKYDIDNLISNNKYQIALKIINRTISKKKCEEFIYLDTYFTKKSIFCHIELDELEIATRLVLEYYFRNGFLFESIISSKLVQKLIDLDGEDIYKEIAVPILFSLYNLPSNTIYDSLANFLILHNIQKPSEVVQLNICENDLYINYFLQYVCIINNFQDSPYFDTIEKIEKERIQILIQLCERLPDRANIYNAEIFDITQKATVRACLQNIYDSRIFVEVNGIKKLLIKDISSYFERYTNIVDFSFQDSSLYIRSGKKKDEESEEYFKYITFFDPPISRQEYDLINFLSEGGLIATHANSVAVPYSRYLAFLDLFEIVKNQFLFNEDYGLKFFLSMRIRHGTLPNYLKNVFERHSLLINEGINRSRLINYWGNKAEEFNLLTINKSIIDLLQVFTQDIENITLEGVSWVKIKESEHDKQSMFDFTFSKNEMFYIFRNQVGRITNIESFIDSIFDIIWSRVSLILEDLRKRFANELLNMYLEKIDLLQNNIDDAYGDNSFIFIKDLLVTTKTDIQNSINNCLNWFSVSKTKLIGEIPLNAIIQTSKEYLNIINANYLINRINYVESIDFDKNIKGEYFTIFCDIFNTLLGNVIKHTKDLHMPNCKMSIFESEGEVLNIVVKNDYSHKYSNEQILDWQLLLNNTDNSISASFEDRSGFLKLKKIFSNDINFKGYDFKLNSTSKSFTFEICVSFKNIII